MRVRWTASGPTIYAYVGNDPLGSVDPQGLNADDLSETPGQRNLEQQHGQDHDVISPLVDTDLNNDGIQDIINPVVMNTGSGKASGSACKIQERQLPFRDNGRLSEINKTLDRISTNGPFLHRKDGSFFKNKEDRLPEGNYREYTVDTTGINNRGARRIVQNVANGDTYYTDDHYKTFIQIDPKKR